MVAPVLAKQLAPEQFGKVVRQLFPAYYLLGMGAAAGGLVSVTALLVVRGASPGLSAAGGIWLIIFLAEAYCRSPLTPQSNAMRDQLKEQESRGSVDPVLKASWERLHQRSLYLNSLVLLGGQCLVGLAS